MYIGINWKNWKKGWFYIRLATKIQVDAVVIRQQRPEFKFPAKIEIAISQIQITSLIFLQ